MNKNKHDSSELPPANLKSQICLNMGRRVTWNRFFFSLPFAVKWPNVDVKVSIQKGLQQEMSENYQCLEHENFDKFII